MHRLLITLSIILLVSILPTPLTHAGDSVAQTSPPNGETPPSDQTPPGVDLVFIVDQSGSMNYGAIINSNDPRCIAGQDDCPRLPQTDPDELAIGGLQDAVNPIVNRILRRSIARETVGFVEEEYYFGVILFGSDAATEIAVPLTRIEIEETQQDNARIVTSNVDQRLPQKARRNFGDTDFDVAFREACAMLNCNVPTPQGRERVMVVLTDGQPSGADRSNPAPYYQGLFSRHQNLFNTTTLWVIGLDRLDEFWSANQPFWEQVAPGRTTRITNPSDISRTFGEIAATSIGVTEFGDFRACDGSTFLVQPYLETLTLVLDYPDLDSRAKFTDARGITIEKGLENVTYRGGGQSEYYTILKPVPGEWKCEVIGTSVVPEFTGIEGAFQFAEVRVEETGDLLASTCRDFKLAVSYLDVDSKPIAELSEYPLQHTLTVSIPDNIQVRPLIRDNGSLTRWVSDSGFSPNVVGGEYPVSVSVQLASTGTQLFADTSTILIDPSLPCIEAILVPQQGARVEMHQMLSLLPMQFEVLLTQGGQPSTPSGNVFREPLTDVLTATVVGPQGYREPVRLMPDPENRPGVFVGQIDTPPETTGTYTFTVGLVGTAQSGNVYVLPPQQTTFSRVLGSWVVAREVGSRVAAGLGFILLIAAVGFFAYMISPPYPRGTLIFERKNVGSDAAVRDWEDIGTLYLARQKWLGLFRTRSVTIKKGLPRDADLRVKRVKIRDHTVAKKSGVKVEVLVDGVKTPHKMDFTRDGQAQPLPGGKYRVKYEAPSK